jgi:integrase
LLDIAQGTGRRISAIRQLRYEDLRLDIKPFGAIRWPEDTDKTGRETVAPITAEVRAAVDRVVVERPGIGAANLFPSPKKQSAPIRHELSQWLLEAEKLAKFPKQSGSCGMRTGVAG